jgi:hypothetical protein
LLRRRGRSLLRRQALPTIIALVALVCSVIALVESTRSDRSSGVARAGPTTTTAAPTTTAPADTTTRASTSVPRVLGLSETDAVAMLRRAGFQFSVETLALANVPTGYVISQSPLPESTAPAGSTVNLIVSARA